MMKFSFFACLFLSLLSYSQTKNEQEKRINQSEFPKIAQNYFNFIAHKTKYLKFYKETDAKKQSFEAKFKINKLHYSIEFDTLGKLEDIEVLVKKRDISKKALKQIDAYFSSNFKKCRIIKIQKQYINHSTKNDQYYIAYIIENPNNKHTHFEIIAEIKTKQKHELREFTFNRDGKFEKSRLITSSSYEHALY